MQKQTKKINYYIDLIEPKRKRRIRSKQVISNLMYGTLIWGVLSSFICRAVPSVDTRWLLLLLPVYGIPYLLEEK